MNREKGMALSVANDLNQFRHENGGSMSGTAAK